MGVANDRGGQRALLIESTESQIDEIVQALSTQGFQAAVRRARDGSFMAHDGSTIRIRSGAIVGA
jgi:hypothetical protein